MGTPTIATIVFPARDFEAGVTAWTSVFGTGPVLVGFAAVQSVCMLGVAAASLRARTVAQPAIALN